VRQAALRFGVKASVYYGKGDIRVESVPDPEIKDPTDAIVRITHACICGSDLWFYRGYERDWKPGFRTGHEWMGIVEEVGKEVKTVKKGDWVLAPFAFSDGKCEFCEKGLFTSCVHGGFWGGENLGGQAEAIRAPFADGTLVKIPESASGDDAVLTRLLPLTDVMGTGYHSVVSANLRAGKTIIVIGDGAVGLCAVLSAKILGAGRIILMGHNPDRLKLGQRFGATDIISTRAKAPPGYEQVSPPPELSRTTSWAGFHLGLAINDAQAMAEAVQMTGGGAESVAECVGLKSSFDLAIGVARPGGVVGFVGVPHVTEAIDLGRMFSQNISLRGGVAPVRAYIPDLMDQVLAEKIDPSPVLEMSVDLRGVPEGYAAMDSRQKIKVMVRP
jgi:threonine dehydrogenase-like Zn-dependent dehydrogenase